MTINNYDDSQNAACQAYLNLCEKLRTEVIKSVGSLPALRGSEKQIAWAEDLRYDMIRSKCKTLASTLVAKSADKANVNPETIIEEARAKAAKANDEKATQFVEKTITEYENAKAALHKAVTETSCRWFIDKSQCLI